MAPQTAKVKVTAPDKCLEKVEQVLQLQALLPYVVLGIQRGLGDKGGTVMCRH